MHYSELIQLLRKDNEELMKLVIIISIKFCCSCFFGTKFYFNAVYFVLLQFKYFDNFNISRHVAAVQSCKIKVGNWPKLGYK